MFRESGYWDARYEEESRFPDTGGHEWFGAYHDFSHLVRRVLRPNTRGLVLGCGTSSMSIELYKEGVSPLVSIDYSPICIKAMEERYAEVPEMSWMVMDARQLQFPDGSFDLVIEKGTLDSMMVDEKDPWRVTTATVSLVDEVLSEARSTLSVYSSSVASRGIIHSNSSRAFANCQSGVGFRPLHKPQWLLVNKKHQEHSVAARELFSSFCSSPLCLQTQVIPYLAKLTNPLRNPAQISFIQDVGRLPLKRYLARMKLEALTDKDPGVADADSEEEDDPSHVLCTQDSSHNAKPKSADGASLLPSSQGDTDLPTSQPQPVTVLEDEELRIEEYDSD